MITASLIVSDVGNGFLANSGWTNYEQPTIYESRWGMGELPT
jgi:hypothetical protein